MAVRNMDTIGGRDQGGNDASLGDKLDRRRQ